MDTTTIIALIAVIVGPIALYFLRKGNKRSNGIVGSGDWKKFHERQKKWWRDTTCPMKFNLPCNIWHEDD
jgi:hypothetical protein